MKTEQARQHRLVILKTGDKIASLAGTPGDYEHWIAAAMDWPMDRLQVVDPRVEANLPEPAGLDGLVITGSGAMVSHREPWMLRTEEWLAHVVHAGVPTLGICFGHQLLAQALGGSVDDNPLGAEVGTAIIRLDVGHGDDPLFASLSDRFPAQVSHRQSVLHLPPDARCLGNSELERHQVIAYGPRVWGIQFHPEFDADIIRHFIDYHAPSLIAAGRDVEDLKNDARGTPESRGLLLRFADIVRSAIPD